MNIKSYIIIPIGLLFLGKNATIEKLKYKEKRLQFNILFLKL